MTPAQRKFDTDLAASMRLMAQQVASRSRKIADTLNVAAGRIEALTVSITLDQPASTPDQAQA